MIAKKNKNLSPLKPDDLKKLPDKEWADIYIQQDSLTASRVIEGEAIIVTSGDGMSHQANETATFIWVRATGEKKFAEIVSELCDEYDVGVENAFEDAKTFVTEGVEKRFLRASMEKFRPLSFDDD
ncbi:MAG: hypothetical protein Kow0090_15340 [Myxococcota bacterium]